MPPYVEGWEFDTACGLFRIEYLIAPEEDADRGRWEYWLQFKWIDPHDNANRATPEYRMRLDLFEADMLRNDAEAKLREALRLWIASAPFCDDLELRFSTDSILLKLRAKENPN